MQRRNIGLAILMALAPAALAAQERLQLEDGWTFAPAVADGERPPDDRFGPIVVAQAWEHTAGTDFDGIGWYRRSLQLDAAWRTSARVRLEFAAVATHARIFVNGNALTEHLGAWTPFDADLTPLLRDGRVRCDGSDRLEVRVDERVGHNTQGFHPIIQPHFGGIWQPVTLTIDDGPSLDRRRLLLFGDLAGRLQVAAPVRVAAGDPALRVAVEVFDGATAMLSRTIEVVDGAANDVVAVDAPRPWSPRTPNLYRVVLTLRTVDGDRACDRVERQVGFRSLEADGRKLRLNGAPLQVRGMLHWGYEPPLLAPNPEPTVWRRELEDLRARGFNLVKCCLWVPPAAFYDIADEIGLLVWQEYPTWHPQLTPEYREALTREFEEFFAHDRSHVSVLFRSLTCETGHGADITVIRDLYERAHRAIPQTLVVDDSSWISWNRIHDFYDDHPYGNNNEWRARLTHFDQFIAARDAKPLLFGECIAADTWFDRDAWLARHGAARPWWAPRCLDDQARFESWLTSEFGAAALAALQPQSIEYAMRNRKYQIERLRLDLPDAGYVVSVLRDFTLARMGMYDPFDQPKFNTADWAWHGDTMLCLDTPLDRRGFVDRNPDLGLRIAHHGPRPLRGTLRVRLDDVETISHERRDLSVAAGTVSERIAWQPELAHGSAPRRLRLHAEFAADRGATISNHWDLWRLPPPLPALPHGVRVADHLTAELLTFVEQGGRLLLRAGDQKGCLRGRALWFLRGAPFTPPHPLNAWLPPELLRELQSFDLERSWVVDWDLLRGQIDPILAFWDTHDLGEVRSYLLLADTRIGAGRLLVSALDHESAAGRSVLGTLGRHLVEGPAPQRALSATTLATLRAELATQVIDLADWQLRPDPADAGVAAGWARGETPTDGWHPVRAGQHWEQQGFPQLNGVVWYRCAIDVPESWGDAQVHTVFEGVDDSYRFYVDGEELARFGDPAKGESVWLQRTTVDLGRRLSPGRHHLVLRVVDHNGAGGLWKPVYLTTGSPDARSDLLQ